MFFVTKAEILTFIEEMGKIDDNWTEEQVQDVYGSYSLADALQDRKASVGMFLNELATATLYNPTKKEDK